MIHKTAGIEDYPVILDVWEKSVAASHDFLADKDFEEIKAKLPALLSKVELLLWYDKSQLIGFSGTQGTVLEMLFLEPSIFSKGYGRQIIESLKKDYGIQTVSVNEQNVRATTFYLKNGFKIINRSELDAAGRPYPILQLSL